MSDVKRTDLARANIQAALRLRGKSSFEISVSLGKNRTYLDDFLKGRKATLASMFAERLARSLDIDLEYVFGNMQINVDEPQSLCVSKEVATAGRIKRTLNFIQSEINDLEGDKHEGRTIDEDVLANAYERRARKIISLNIAEQKIRSSTPASTEERYDKIFESDWIVSQVFAKQALSTSASYLTVIRINDT